MPKIPIETAEEAQVCGHKMCDNLIEVGDPIYRSSVREDIYCSPLCRVRHGRLLTQQKRRDDPYTNRMDNDRRIWRKYGINSLEFKKLWDQQFGRCAVCQDPFDDGRPHVDHDHDTGVVRGLLCSLCNVGIGYFKDDPDRLLAAVAYLTEGGER